MKNQQTNWWIDAILFICFIVTFLMGLTGLELHQWIGIAIGAIILVYLRVHWSWVVTVVERFFGNTSCQARIDLLIDSTLVGGFLMIILTGLLISTWLYLPFISYDIWKNIHILASVATLFVVLLKIDGVEGAASLVGISQLVKLTQASIDNETKGLVAQVS